MSHFHNVVQPFDGFGGYGLPGDSMEVALALQSFAVDEEYSLGLPSNDCTGSNQCSGSGCCTNSNVCTNTNQCGGSNQCA